MFQPLFKALFYKAEDFRLRLHFARALQYLTNDQSIASKSVEEQARRQALVEHLRNYRRNNIFPRNSDGGSPKPYFFDVDHRACAVADLLIRTGEAELADEISAWKNNAYVREMEFPELLNWAKKYGVSQQDLMVIQPSYSEITPLGLMVLVMSCANLLFVLLHGSRHFKNTLMGLVICLFLLLGTISG
jgi:hypothetical protein